MANRVFLVSMGQTTKSSTRLLRARARHVGSWTGWSGVLPTTSGHAPSSPGHKARMAESLRDSKRRGRAAGIDGFVGSTLDAKIVSWQMEGETNLGEKR